MVFYIFPHYQMLLQNRAHMCNILFITFWYFRNKDHWWGLRSESKRLKVCILQSYYFSTLKPIINIVWKIVFSTNFNQRLNSSYTLKTDYSQVSFISSITKRESLVYFKSRGVSTTASVAIPTECISPPLFSLLLSAPQSVTWQWNSGAWRGAWNLK